MSDEQSSNSVHLDIPFPSPRIAEIVHEVLRVDTEPARSGVTKEFIREDNILHVKLHAQLARQLRVAVNGLFENLHVIVETIEFAGPPVSESYSHYC